MNKTILAIIIALGTAGPAHAQWFTSGDQAWDAELSKRLNRAAELAGQTRYKAAMKEYAWCLDNLPNTYPEFEESATRFIISNMNLISSFYPKVKKTMVKRRNSAKKKIIEGEANLAVVHEFAEFNTVLGDWYMTLELYDNLEDMKDRQKRIKMRQLLFWFVEEALIEEKRYDDFLSGARKGPADLEVRREKLEELLKSTMGLDEKYKKMARMNLCRSAARYYQAMLAKKMYVDARRLAYEYLEYERTAANYRLFIRHAVRAKKYKTARKLLAKAEDELGRMQYQEVEQEKAYIPDKKKSSKKKGKKKKKKKKKDDD